MRRGRFIAFEGGEGSGKSTQAALLAEALRAEGHEVVSTREPGGTSGAEAIRQLLLDPPGAGWRPRAEALLFAAARSDHVESLIEPALANGKWVVCDRYVDSSRAYQGTAGKLGDEDIRRLHQFGSLDLLPDLTLLMLAPAAEVATRVLARDGDRQDAIGGRGARYHDAVAAAFQTLADTEPNRFRVVDGSATVEEVHQRVIAEVSKLRGFAG